MHLTVLPALDVLVNIVLALMPLDQLGISYQSAIAMETAAYGVLPTLTLTVTVLIATRLFLVRRRHIKVIGEHIMIYQICGYRFHDSPGMSPTSGPYLGIVAMLVESFALESVWSIGSAVSVGLRHPSILLFGTCDSTVKVGDPMGRRDAFDISPMSRSLPTFLSFIVSQRGEDGRLRQGPSSRAYSGITIHRPQSMKSAAAPILKCL